MVGLHMIVDMYHCKRWLNLQDPKVLEDILRRVIQLADMKLIKLNTPILYEEFDSSFGWGWSFSAILADSHATIHTAPSINYSVFFDMYSCKQFNLPKVLEFILDKFNPSRYVLNKIFRNEYLNLPEPV